MKIVKPTLKDIKKIKDLLAPFIKEGIILNRDEDEIAMNIRSYQVVKKDSEIIGVGALHIYSQFLAEIRSLAIKKEFQKNGIGRLLVEGLLNEAKDLGIKEVLVLTYEKDFFLKLGFVEIEKEAIPDKKIWADCIKCKFFPNCNEVALITYIS